MTLLSAINEAADVVNLSRFGTVTGDDDNATTMVAMANEAGDEIARRVDWQAMLKSAAIPASPYTLPEDFQRIVPGAPIRTALGIPVRPVTNGSEWAALSAAPSSQPFYHRSGSALNILPLTAAVGASFLYVSAHWARDENGTDYKPRISADGDTTLFPERLLVKGIIWRWRRQKGLDYSDQMAEFEADLAQEIRADRGLA